MQRYQNNTKGDWLDALATRIAEVRLSELGYNFVPSIARQFFRNKKHVEAKARIVKSVSLMGEANKKSN